MTNPYLVDTDAWFMLDDVNENDFDWMIKNENGDWVIQVTDIPTNTCVSKEMVQKIIKAIQDEYNPNPQRKMVGLLATKIAVTPLYDDDKTAGGLYIPESAIEKCDQGIVKYVGPEVKYVEIGDHVLFSGYTGTTARIEGEGVLIIMHEEFVTCKILPPETDISGLYFRDAKGEYWEATYEMSIELIRRAMEDRKVKASAFKPHTIARG